MGSALEPPGGPSILAAQGEIGQAILARLRVGPLFDEPETWLVCACAVLLAHEPLRRACD